jgi:uncharacterized protein YdhG (YjbR/CyaY superfamily)
MASDTIESYLATVSPEMRVHLAHIRQTTKSLVPDVSEKISYGMPVFQYKSKYLLGYAAFKNHMSIFPGPEAIHMLEDALSNYKIAKGTIQFTASDPLPDELLSKIISLRVYMIDNR